MNCPSCGAPMTLAAGGASMFCDYCRHVEILQPDSSGVRYLEPASPELDCAVCSSALWNATLAGVKLFACKQCGGMLIAMAVFETLIDELRAAGQDAAIPPPPAPGDLQRRIDCPKCHQRMDVHYYYGGGSAVMGGCEHCEMNWLNGGVLMRIVHTPHGGSAEPQAFS